MHLHFPFNLLHFVTSKFIQYNSVDTKDELPHFISLALPLFCLSFFRLNNNRFFFLEFHNWTIVLEILWHHVTCSGHTRKMPMWSYCVAQLYDDGPKKCIRMGEEHTMLPF